MFVSTSWIFFLPLVLAASQSPVVSPSFQSILTTAFQPPLNSYPTNFTQGILPVPIHSHNDYWRPIPLYTALSAGCISIEADVWLVNGSLHVGHERAALTKERTFESLYINPLLRILQGQNPMTEFTAGSTSKNGVYDTSSDQTLYLFVDLKTDGASTWPVVLRALRPLRDAGFLSTYTNGTLSSAPVTVVGTGNTPLDQVSAANPRDAFYDAPLAKLNDSANANVTSNISPIASTNFAVQFGTIKSGGFNETQLTLLRDQISNAHLKGIRVRYWNQPGWPISTRNAVWRTLVDEGADLINADDVIAAAGFSDRTGYW